MELKAMGKMVQITVKTPFKGKFLQVNWDGGKVKVSGGREALLYWKDVKSQGLYGLYGHIVDLDETFLTDLVVALQNRIAKEDMEFGPGVARMLAKEQAESKPFPEGAVS